MQFYRAMLKGKAADVSQALNYGRHVVMICHKAMTGNHSLNVALNPLSTIGNDLLNLKSNREPNFGS